MYRKASISADQARAGGIEASRGACVGRRISAVTPAASSRQTPVTAKLTYGPKALLTTPPREAPTMVIVPQEAPAIALAGARSAASTTLGSAADAAGE
jgi:hypothetical protein